MRITLPLILAGGLVCAAAWGAPTAAASTEVSADALFQARSLQCTWGPGVARQLGHAESLWTTLLRSLGMVPLTEFGPGNVSSFDQIDRVAGTARLIGNQGSGPIPLQTTPAGLTFIETVDSGGVSTTTVFTKAVPGGYAAVLSRHMDFFGEVVVSQYAGLCTVVGLPTPREWYKGKIFPQPGEPGYTPDFDRPMEQPPPGWLP